MLIHHIFLKSLLILILSGLTPRESTVAPQSDEPIKIGLLIPDSKSFAARQGAELAINLC